MSVKIYKSGDRKFKADERLAGWSFACAKSCWDSQNHCWYPWHEPYTGEGRPPGPDKCTRCGDVRPEGLTLKEVT